MRHAFLALTIALLAASPLHAAQRAECIAPAKPGGGFDLTCRLLRDLLKMPPEPATEVDVKYLPGGIGALAFDRAVSQRWSDPRTLVAFSTGSIVNLVQGKFGPHDVDDVRWLATLGVEYGVIAVRKDSPLVSVRELRARLARNPSAAVFGASGTVGSQDWIKAALVVRAAGSDHRAMRFVSFEGGGQALAALMGGHVDVFCGDMLETAEAAARGEVRLLAVLAPERLPGRLAQVPTAREQGLDVVWRTVRGVYMGPAVGASDYAAWAQALQRRMNQPGFSQLLAAHGLQPHPLTGADAQAYVRQQAKEMRELALGLHLRVR
jgi:putative tricarboxylic transport membrane protein